MKLKSLIFLAICMLLSCNDTKENQKEHITSNTFIAKESESNVSIYKIDVNTSKTTYIGSKPTGKHNGTIAIQEGFFKASEDDILEGKVILNMNSISVDDLDQYNQKLGKSMLINHLKSNDFLDVENYPKGIFKITSVIPYQKKSFIEEKEKFESVYSPLSSDQHKVDHPTHTMSGELTLRGVTKQISFPVRIQKLHTKLKLDAKFNIDRTNWNIKYGEEASITDKIKDKFIYNTVNVGFDVEAISSSKKVTDPALAPKTIDVFEKKFGIHQGKRRNHISGFCFSGNLTIKDPEILQYTKSKIFSSKPLKVTGRFSHKGGVKKDERKPGEYGMAFEVTLEDNSAHNFSMNTLDFFPVKSPEGFHQLMQAKVSGKPEDFDQLKKNHPEFKNFKAHYKNKPKVLKNYTNHQFNSVNSFYLENEKGITTPIRWSFVPKNRESDINPSEKIDFYKETQNALQDQKQLVWEMIITIANSGDAIEDASSMWKGDHKQIVAATLVIDHISKDNGCELINFDPLHLQAGILPSNDPILKFRSPAYATAFVRRLQEHNNKQTSKDYKSKK